MRSLVSYEMTGSERFEIQRCEAPVEEHLSPTTSSHIVSSVIFFLCWGPFIQLILVVGGGRVAVGLSIVPHVFLVLPTEHDGLHVVSLHMLVTIWHLFRGRLLQGQKVSPRPSWTSRAAWLRGLHCGITMAHAVWPDHLYMRMQELHVGCSILKHIPVHGRLQNNRDDRTTSVDGTETRQK